MSVQFQHAIQHIYRFLLHCWRSSVARWIRIVILACIGAWLAVLLWGGATAPFALAEVHGSLRPAMSGETRIFLPPFGAISAHTHNAPVQLQVRVEQLHVDSLLNWVKDAPNRQVMITMLQHESLRFARQLALFAVLVGMLGAVVLGAVTGLRRLQLFAASLLGAAAVMLPLALMAVTYHADAFASPTYHGELARAPELLQAAQQGWKNYDSLQERLPVVIDRMTRFYRQLDRVTLTPLPEEKELRRVLLISDLHNNPLGMNFALNLAREYRVDLVLVAGDITDLGHPLEAQILQRWRDFSVPVVVVSGNHDSHAIMNRLAGIRGVTVLDHGNVITKDGLRIMGFGDPAADRDGVGSVDPTSEELSLLRREIRSAIGKKGAPDILMVHNPRVGVSFLRRVPVTLSGHTHSPDFKRRGQHVLVNGGTTGAAGLRYFTGVNQPPFGAVVLHFTRDDSPRLQLLDYIELEEPAGNFAIRRINMMTQTADAERSAIAENLHQSY